MNLHEQVPVQNTKAMKPIKILSVLMILLLAGSGNIIDFSGSETNAIQESQRFTTGKMSPKEGPNSCLNRTEDKSIRPAGTFDRFDPYTLQGKTYTAGIMVF
jgi:hypothetical protein